MRFLTLCGLACTIAMILLSCDAKTSIDDDSMFDFARAELDRALLVGKPKGTAKNPNNFYLKVQMQVGKAMAIAKGMRRTYSDSLIKKTALRAAQAGLVPEALSALGHGLFNEFQRQNDCIKKRRQSPAKSSARCRHTRETAGIIDQLRQSLGNDTFDKVMNVNGGATLVFTIDTSGSMSTNINKAKAIIKEIASYQRENQVDYVLSPFNDPETGPVFGKQGDRRKFLEKVEQLNAFGGGDCPEKTFHGIIDAIEKGKPKVGSPMFVFTDAGPKDQEFNDQYNIDTAIGLALQQDMSVNFFSDSIPSCTFTQTFPQSFKDIIEDTGGIAFFSRERDINEMAEIVKASLDGMTTIGLGGSSSHGRGKRSVPGTKRYSIAVDDTVSKLMVVLTTHKSPELVELRNPGNAAISQSQASDFGAIWIINAPRPGEWSLVVPRTVGSHSFKVASSSSVNIDFDHYFVWTLPSQRGVEFPIVHPLQNRVATVKLLMPLKNKVKMGTLSLEAVHAEDGRVLNRIPLTGITGRFTPPSVPFKLRLKGRTSGGFPFERTSRMAVKAYSTLLRMVYNRNYVTLPVGKTSRVLFAFHNVGKTDRFRFSVTTSLPAGASIRSPSTAYRVSSRRVRYFSARIRPTVPGTPLPVIVAAKHESTGKTASMFRVTFLID